VPTDLRMVEWAKRMKEKMRELEKFDALKICVEESKSVQSEINPK
jgi:hypothetical protein